MVQGLVSSALEDASAAVHQDDVRELAKNLGSRLMNGAENRFRAELLVVHRPHFEVVRGALSVRKSFIRAPPRQLFQRLDH